MRAARTDSHTTEETQEDTKSNKLAIDYLKWPIFKQ